MVASANPRELSFENHESVIKAFDSLYQAIADSIEDMILLTTNERPACKRYPGAIFLGQFSNPPDAGRRIVSRLEHRKKKIEVDTVLQHLSEKNEALKRAIGMARDKEIQTTGRTARYAAVQTTMVRRDITENHKLLDDKLCSLERKTSDLKATMVEQIAQLKDHHMTKILAEAATMIEQRKDKEFIDFKNVLIDLLVEANSTLLCPPPYYGQAALAMNSRC